jgi:hypothetical protein
MGESGGDGGLIVQFLNYLAEKTGIPKWGQFLLVGVAGAAIAVFIQIHSMESDLQKMQAANDVQFKGIKDAIRVLAAKSLDKDVIKEILPAAIDQKVQPLEKRINGLDASMKAAETERLGLKKSIDQQTAIVRIDNPARILAIIRGEIEVAENSARMMPEVQIVDYKRAVLGIPT